ncbi:MAG: hypothetical protein QW841_01815 [Candidatus Aenigmatarchaeota archaeon]
MKVFPNLFPLQGLTLPLIPNKLKISFPNISNSWRSFEVKSNLHLGSPWRCPSHIKAATIDASCGEERTGNQLLCKLIEFIA